MNVNNTDDLKTMLPDFKKELDCLRSTSFKEYESKLERATEKALEKLEDLIDDGTLALDPEQLVNAVKVLTTSRKDIMENKRRLIETIMKGEIMLKAMEPKPDENNSALLDYMKNNMKQLENTESSIFQQVNNLEE